MRERLKAVVRRLLRRAWRLSARVGRRPGPLPGGQRIEVVILSYARPWNIDPLVRTVLRCGFVDRVVLSNNNPDIPTSSFLRVRDPRLVVIDQPDHTGPGVRFELAREHLADLDGALLIDDDWLLWPSQIRRLVEHLFAAPEVPHGLSGRLGDIGLLRVDSEADVLFGVYAVTGTHLDRYVELYDALPQAARDLVDRGGEDIVISMTGDRRAIVHDVGYILFCASVNRAGVAISARPDFVTSRKVIREQLDLLGGALPWRP